MSVGDASKHRNIHGRTLSKAELGWDMTQLQATSFAIDWCQYQAQS